MTKHKCIFVHIPKAAGTSVLHALNGSGGHLQRDHASVQTFISANRYLFDTYFSFAFVRHPFSRAQSSYQYLKNGGNKTTDIELAKFINDNYCDVNEFILKHLTSSRVANSLLFKPQSSFICDEFNQVQVDFLGKFENLENDFAYVCKKLKISVHLPKANMSSLKDHSCILNTESKQILHKIYADDFDVFGYSAD